MTKVATKGAVHAAPHRKSLASRIWEHRQMKDTVKLRVLLDTWSMELFLNDGEQAVTTLLYTPRCAQDVLLRAPKPIRYTFESHEIDMMEDDGE